MKQEIGDPVRDFLIPIRRECPSANSLDYFFPKTTFSSDAGVDDAARAHWNAAFLLAHEPPLSCGNFPDEAYRLTTAMVLSDYTWSVRVYRDRQERKLYVAKVRHDLYGKRFTEVLHVARDLSQAEWTEIESGMTRVAFWSLPTEVIGAPMLDGGGALLEGRSHNSYQIVGRQLPSEQPITNVIKLLRRLSRQDIDFSSPDQ